ncbi:MAG TPA: hypothetical protein VLU23_05695 [Pseudolabrys sp.]|nr:hypothetical protein [Pseudolabrys sp.]
MRQLSAPSLMRREDNSSRIASRDVKIMKFMSVGVTMSSFIQHKTLKHYRNMLSFSAGALSLLALWFVMVAWLMGDVLWPQLAGVH